LNTAANKRPNFHITNKLDVATHIKPTNKQAYVHAKSYHPPGTSKGIIKGEMKRFLRTNSRAESSFKSKHKQNLLKRGYHKDFINQYTKSIRFRDRSLALKPKPKELIKRGLLLSLDTLRQQPRQ